MKTMKKMKTYRTDRGNLSTCVEVNGKSVRIRFISKDSITGYFSTSDTDLQKGIEADYSYGVKFDEYLVGEEQCSEVTPLECTPVVTVNTWQQAKEFMHASPYNLPLRALTSPEKIRSAALMKGVVFPNIEN